MTLINGTPTVVDLPELLAAIKTIAGDADVDLHIWLNRRGDGRMREWAAILDLPVPETSGQPYPKLGDPEACAEWIPCADGTVGGVNVHLGGAAEPINVRQRAHWVASGAAARHGGPKPDGE